MGQRVEFPSHDHPCAGYLALPAAGRGPAVVVIQEWWGLVPHIEDVVERFASEGFVALAPDLYHGKTTRSPDDAMKMLMELDAERAEREIAGAGAFLLARPECSSRTWGVVGFCMGGALAQYAATKESGVGAAVSFYGGFKKAPVDWGALTAPLLLFYGEEDSGVSSELGMTMARQFRDVGKDVEAVVYAGVGHAFFNDTRKENYNGIAAEDAWKRTMAHFRKHVR